eukprot:scaffold4085_cov264-Prasinococcus_capsulatus_cf.AAC.3
MPRATASQWAKPSGETNSATGRWPLVGCMYCPSVTTSTPPSRSCCSAACTSSAVSPSPSMMDVLVSRAPLSFAFRRTASDCSQPARRSRTCACRREAVTLHTQIRARAACLRGRT